MRAAKGKDGLTSSPKCGCEDDACRRKLRPSCAAACLPAEGSRLWPGPAISRRDPDGSLRRKSAASDGRCSRWGVYGDRGGGPEETRERGGVRARGARGAMPSGVIDRGGDFTRGGGVRPRGGGVRARDKGGGLRPRGGGLRGLVGGLRGLGGGLRGLCSGLRGLGGLRILLVSVGWGLLLNGAGARRVAFSASVMFRVPSGW